MRVGKKHSQHKILLPAWLTAAHSDGCALNILHLQGHVCVKFLCKKVANTNVISHAADYTKQPDSVTISNKNGRYPQVTTHLVVHQAWLSSLQTS